MPLDSQKNDNLLEESLAIKEMTLLVRELFTRTDVKQALDAARIISTFADRPPLHLIKELYPDVRPDLLNQYPILDPTNPTRALEHDQLLMHLATEKRCPEFQRGRLFTCVLDNYEGGTHAGFRAGHNVDGGLTEKEFEEIYHSGSIPSPDKYLFSDSFRGMYGFFKQDNIEIYTLALDGNLSRQRFDKEIQQLGQGFLKMLSDGLKGATTTNGMYWIDNHTPNRKLLVVTDVVYNPQQLLEITYP